MTNKTESSADFVDASRIFTGYRALGLVSNHIPLVTRYLPRSKDTHIITVIGNSFQTYGVSFDHKKLLKLILRLYIDI